MADEPINSKLNQEVITQDGGKTEIRRTVAHLPAYYRTDTNQRFLSSTLDQLIQKGSLQRLDGYVGRQYAYTKKSTDQYITATSTDRKNYQLEPTVTYIDKDTSSINPEDQIKFSATYDDYINQLQYFGAPVNNHDRLNKEVVYSWNPAIDYDKLVNYREYYWLPEGPNPITISTVGTSSVSEIKVTTVTGAYNFSTEGAVASLTNNPTITLYRGNTYKFILNALGHPFNIMTEPFKTGVAEDGSTSVLYTNGIAGNGTEEGTLTFTVPTDAPDVLHYQCSNHTDMHGVFLVKTISATTKIDVAKNVLGTKNYKTSSGVQLSNGMKVKFESNVTDETTYKDKEFYVEGVGDRITLTNVDELITPESYATESTILYDAVAYDSRPYAKAFYRPETKDYITIKRDSLDRNAWARYNRWFHKVVIEATATANGSTAEFLETDRAKRPIIEFDSGLALYNHGSFAKKSVTLIDTITTDVFSTIVNGTGYIIDGVPLADSMRVLFTADTDTLVKNKIYKVNFVTSGTSSVINLTEEADATPGDEESIFIELGTAYQGKTFKYNGTTKIWETGQSKTKVNEQPLFAMYDENEKSFEDSSVYESSDFIGAKVFEYKISDTATADTVLGIKVKYNTINNVGDIVFECDTSSGTFKYKSGDVFVTKSYAGGHLRYTTSSTTYNKKSSWIKRTVESKQRVIRTFTVDDTEKILFPVDVYKTSAKLTDLEICVDVNNVNKDLKTDYTLVNGTINKYIKFNKELKENDIVKLTLYSSSPKLVNKGLYEIPENISRNPLNDVVKNFYTWTDSISCTQYSRKKQRSNRNVPRLYKFT